MQIIPAAQAMPAPAAAEGVQAMGLSGLPSTSGVSFESVLAASVQNARSQLPQSPGDSPGGQGQGLTAFGLISNLRRRLEPPPEAAEEAIPQDSDYILLGALAGQQAPIQVADTDSIPQTDGEQPGPDGVAHILQGNYQPDPADPISDGAPPPPPATDGPGAQAPDFREMMARMPQTQPSREAPATEMATPPTATEGGSCPLENVYDPTTAPTDTLELATLAENVAAKAPVLPVAQPEEKPAPVADTAAQPLAAPEAAVATPRPAAPAQEAFEANPEADSGRQDTDTPKADPGLVQGQPIDIGALRAQGELEMQQPTAAPAATATTETLLDTLVQEMSLTRQGDSHQLEIQLKPEHLGKVSIQLTLDDTGLQAKIRAEDPTVRSLIGSQMNQLVEALEQKGIRLAGVEVAYQAAQGQDFGQQGGGRQDMGQEGRNRGLPAQAIQKAGPSGYAEAHEALEMDTYVASGQEPAPAAAYTL